MMEIIKYTKHIGGDSRSMGLLTLEFSLQEMQDAISTMSNEGYEQFVGRRLLSAMHQYKLVAGDPEMSSNPHEEKRRPGRPKGSKNKPKSQPQENQNDTNPVPQES
jgi:hypothetical protein